GAGRLPAHLRTEGAEARTASGSHLGPRIHTATEERELNRAGVTAIGPVAAIGLVGPAAAAGAAQDVREFRLLRGAQGFAVQLEFGRRLSLHVDLRFEAPLADGTTLEPFDRGGQAIPAPPPSADTARPPPPARPSRSAPPACAPRGSCPAREGRARPRRSTSGRRW